MKTNQDSQHEEQVGKPFGASACSTFLVVEANVRYWEDATINGAEDINGDLTPCRVGNLWNPTINIETGEIQRWPQGTVASIYFKVCDEGRYWIVDDEGNMQAKWKGHYVPDEILAIGDSGYGDYIILEVGADGLIKDWKKPQITEEDWDILSNDAITDGGSKSQQTQ
jgi:hypothetical protein